VFAFRRVAARIALVVALLLTPALRSLAQPVKSPASVDALLRSIGLSKPAMSGAPDFNLLDVNGSPVSLSGYRGKLVLLNFWATWCGPCREEMASMEQLSRNFGGQRLAVLAINQRENAALVNRFLRTHGLNFTTPLDTTGRVAGYYRVYGIPVSYLIDADGEVIGMKSGSMDWGAPKVVEALRKLIGDSLGEAASAASLNLEPTKPLPRTLRAKFGGVLVHAQQNAQSEVVGKIDRADDLIPLGKVSDASEFWYMVRTKNGAIGWVRGSEVEEISRR
jgi:thiol-disulfide isomerase/thioredoxin